MFRGHFITSWLVAPSNQCELACQLNADADGTSPPWDTNLITLENQTSLNRLIPFYLFGKPLSFIAFSGRLVLPTVHQRLLCDTNVFLPTLWYQTPNFRHPIMGLFWPLILITLPISTRFNLDTITHSCNSPFYRILLHNTFPRQPLFPRHSPSRDGTSTWCFIFVFPPFAFLFLRDIPHFTF